MFPALPFWVKNAAGARASVQKLQHNAILEDGNFAEALLLGAGLLAGSNVQHQLVQVSTGFIQRLFAVSNNTGVKIDPGGFFGSQLAVGSNFQGGSRSTERSAAARAEQDHVGTGGGQGGFVLYDLLTTLVIIFVIAALLLPLLLDFGLLEFVGALLTKVMRPLFKVPGRAAVDCITSWIGDGTLGVMLTCNQYEGGYYSAKEASIIATLFSAVSITFTLVVLDTVGMLDKFGIYYLIVCFVGIVCAIVCPYLYPLRKKPNTYLVEGKAAPDTLPEGYKSNVEYGMDLAMKRVAEHKGIGEFFKSGAKNACSMWFGVLPSVMAIGTIALILANYTPIFEWLGIPFRPLLQLLQVPEADAVASTMIVGFTDMLTPAILIAESTSQMAKFIVAVVSVTQVLYLSEVGGLILGSKLPLNIWELFVIFLERTIISLLIVCPIAHLLF